MALVAFNPTAEVMKVTVAAWLIEPPRNLRVQVRMRDGERFAELSWDPVPLPAMLDRYVISVDGQPLLEIDGKRTRVGIGQDDFPGRIDEVEWSVHAVDVSGNEGPAAVLAPESRFEPLPHGLLPTGDLPPVNGGCTDIFGLTGRCN